MYMNRKIQKKMHVTQFYKISARYSKRSFKKKEKKIAPRILIEYIRLCKYSPLQKKQEGCSRKAVLFFDMQTKNIKYEVAYRNLLRALRVLLHRFCGSLMIVSVRRSGATWRRFLKKA